jgi:radical SAM superfamily enzyme YgiQ (UPF0313 family)
MNKLDWKPCRKLETFKTELDMVHILGFSRSIKLNMVGSIIWKMSNGKNTIMSIIKHICNIFIDVDEHQIEADVLQILIELEENGVLIQNWDPLFKSRISEKTIAFRFEKEPSEKQIDIVLINSPSAHPGSIVSHRLYGMPPLGLGYLGTWLTQKNYAVKIIDFYRSDVTFIDLLETIQINNPKIIAISTTTETYNTGIQIATLCKEISKDLLIVMGGSHVTFEFEHALMGNSVDIVARYEGEMVLENICNWFIRKEIKREEIKGICYKADDKIIKTKREKFIEDLDNLPFPDRSLYDLDKYMIPGVISTSRGCVGNCIFCAATALSGGKYRVRSPQSIIEEMKYLKNLNVPFIQIVDDTMTADINRLYNVLNLLIDSDFEVEWGCESRVDIINKELLLLMKKAGCRYLQFGVEAGNQQMLDCLKKDITMDQIKSVFLWCKELDIRTGTCFMIGQPYDTLQSIADSINFAIELQSYGAKVVFSVTTPFPGTYIYKYPEKLGLTIIEKDFDYYNTYSPIYITNNFSIEDIQKLHFDAILTLSANQKDETRLQENKVWNEFIKKAAETI